MIIQIDSRWLSLVLVIGEQRREKAPPATNTSGSDEQIAKLPTGTEEARRPKIIGLVK